LIFDINKKVREYFKGHPPDDGDESELRIQALDSYQHIGEIVELQQKFSEALKNFDQYVRILKLLANRDPGDAQRQFNLALGLEKYGAMHAQLEQYDDALNSFSKSLQILQSLAPKNPKNLRFQQALSRLLEKRGDAFKDLYKLEEAENSYRDSFNLRAQLTKLQPDNPGWQGEFSSTSIDLATFSRFRKSLMKFSSTIMNLLKFDSALPIYTLMTQHGRVILRSVLNTLGTSPTEKER
jgi:tetratricopeptide (TPR) repeat protein